MRYASVFLVIGSFVLVASGEDAELPYTAFVLSGNAPVRSAPGKVHYPTTRLKRGAKVEVYRHDPGGWLAIRPPRGSFSLVPANYLEMADEPGIARVTEADVAALIGTDKSSPKELMWQVQLKQNEPVELLGVSTEHRADGNSEDTWYKIAPPAGEFRWIHERFVTRDANAVVTNDKNAAKQQQLPPSPPPANAEEEKKDPDWDDGFVARKRRQTDSATKDVVGVPVATSETKRASIPAAQPSPDPGDDLLDQIALLDVELSLMVAGDEATWRTAELEQRAESLLSQATTNLQRGRARLLLNRVEEFHELENRYKEIRLAASPEDLASGESPGAPEKLDVDDAAEVKSSLRERLNQPGAEPAGVKFDGQGYLMPVHSKRPDVPPFALVDGTGRIIQYVTPAPGVNLHRYRKLEVGLFGQRGFVPTLKTPHVTAQRIVVLERRR